MLYGRIRNDLAKYLHEVSSVKRVQDLGRPSVVLIMFYIADIDTTKILRCIGDGGS